MERSPLRKVLFTRIYAKYDQIRIENANFLLKFSDFITKKKFKQEHESNQK